MGSTLGLPTPACRYHLPACPPEDPNLFTNSLTQINPVTTDLCLRSFCFWVLTKTPAATLCLECKSFFYRSINLLFFFYPSEHPMLVVGYTPTDLTMFVPKCRTSCVPAGGGRVKVYVSAPPYSPSPPPPDSSFSSSSPPPPLTPEQTGRGKD